MPVGAELLGEPMLPDELLPERPLPVMPLAPRLPAFSALYSSCESLPSLFRSSSLKRVLSSEASFASSREM